MEIEWELMGKRGNRIMGSDGNILFTSTGATDKDIPEYLKLLCNITKYRTINLYIERKEAEWVSEKYEEELKFIVNPAAKKKREEDLENIIYDMLKAMGNILDMLPDGVLKTALKEEVGETNRNVEKFLKLRR